jgi:hypothetical protein
MTGTQCTPKRRMTPNSPIRMQTGIFLLALLVGACALAQKPKARLRGSWTATISPTQVFTGTWTAEVSSRKANEAHGYWTLLAADGTIRAEGRWSARKTGRSWHGTWTARNGDGRPFSGSWSANINGSSDEETFADMLKSTATKILTGSWQRGVYAGKWWLRGPSHSNNP